MNFRPLLILSSFLWLESASAQDWESLPKKVVPEAVVTDASPVDSAVLEKSIKEGVDFLVETQNANGSWGNATRTKKLNIYAPLPGAHHGYRMGSTALALCGVIASGDTRPEVKASIEKCEEWLETALPSLKRADGTTIYNNWGHAYGIRALVALAKRPGVSAQKRQKYKDLAKGQMESLEKYQDLDGGWGYLSKVNYTARPSGGSNSFTTATVLLALKEAEECFGLSFDDTRIQKALESIKRQRTPDFSYSYSTVLKDIPRHVINRPAGSLARTPGCHAATRVWSDASVITDARIIESLDRLVKRNGWLDLGRKRPIPHETHFSVSGYFYFFGHYYASEAVTLLPKNQQAEWQNKLARIIMSKQESDGSWWDYPLYNYHQAYGTGYALVTLSRCRLK